MVQFGYVTYRCGSVLWCKVRVRLGVVPCRNGAVGCSHVMAMHSHVTYSGGNVQSRQAQWW